MSSRKKVVYLWKHMLMMCISFISVFPFIWMLISSTNTSAEISMGKLSVGSHLVENVKKAFEAANIGRALVNSIYISAMVTLLSILVCSAAGYAFVIYKSKLTELIFLILILSMMVPFAAKLIPLYRIFAEMHLLNSHWAIILPAIGAPFLVFFFRQNTENFTIETIRAARVDGCSEIKIFTGIYMPMMRSSYAAAAIFSFMAAWNNYMWPLVALQSEEKYTLPLMVSNMARGFTPDYGIIMVGILISTLPTVVIFFMLQKSFVEGILGSIK